LPISDAFENLRGHGTCDRLAGGKGLSVKGGDQMLRGQK
jgi:hypothetical protein